MKRNLFVFALTIGCSVLLSSVFAFEVVHYEIAKDGYGSTAWASTNTQYKLYKFANKDGYYIDLAQWRESGIPEYTTQWKTEVIIINGQKLEVARVPDQWANVFKESPSIEVLKQQIVKTSDIVIGSHK